jgi:Leucine-rich repeat (LRR) protein
MNYINLSTEKLDTSPTAQYPSYLNIRDENATGAMLLEFLDIGTDNHTISNVTIISKQLKSLPRGVFKYLKALKNLQFYQCEMLEEIEEIPEVTEALSLSIMGCPKVVHLPNSVWNNPNLKSLRLDNLPLLQIPKAAKKGRNILEKSIKFFQQNIGQSAESDTMKSWHWPKMTSLSLLNVPIQTLPAIHAELLRGFSIKSDDFVGFDAQQPDLPKLDKLHIKSKVFNDISSLKMAKKLQFLELHDIKATLDWSALLVDAFTTFLTLKNCSAFTISKMVEPNSKIRILRLENCEVTTLPSFIGKCRGLNQFSLINCPISTLPDGLAEKKQMYEIRLSHCRFNEIPPVIFKTPIEFFSLYNNQVPLNAFPKDWSGLKKLIRLDLSNNNHTFTDLDFLDDLPKLTSLDINGNTLKNRYSLLRKKKLPLEKQSYSIFKNCKYTKRKEIVAACRALANAPITEADQRYFLDEIWKIKRMSDFPNPSNELLLKGLCVAWTPMNTYFKEILATRIKEHNQQQLTFSADSVVCTIGKLTLKKAELRTQIEDLNATYTPKFSSKVTHVILGKHPKQFDLFDYKDLHICTEQQFQSYVAKQNPSFLEDSTEGEENLMIQNLYLLLQNPDPANFDIALAILKNGGVPNGMLEDLLILQKTHESAAVRGKLRDLLKLYGPEEWQPILQDRHNFYKLAQGKEQEWVVTKKLRKIAVQTAPKYAVMLSILLYKKFGKGLRYALLQQGKVEADLYENIINDLVNDGTLDWSKAIGKRQNEQLNYAGEYAHSYYTSVAKIPTKLLANTLVSTINFEDCGLKKLPKEVFAFTQLTTLHLSKNQLTELPDEVKNLVHLTHLDLSDNQFLTCPSVIFQLKQLQYLKLSGNAFILDNKQLAAKIKLALPDCSLVIE